MNTAGPYSPTPTASPASTGTFYINEVRCPNCGYCPHCGRSNGYYLPYPSYPTWPVYNPYPTYVWNYDTNNQATSVSGSQNAY